MKRRTDAFDHPERPGAADCDHEPVARESIDRHVGEWGIYDHPVGCLHPAVRTVPWETTSATDRETYEPALEHEADGSAVEERLQALGYVG
ncbi:MULTISPECIES: hypothetical protein [Natrialbaceae]|uniref:hypothetical protein n=1 Tax=Natrialbaceae TaxID=1644061 RepID=UPI00207D2DD6|nr:hypothetical protein [Natronococcus sp. CG52]